ncbi:MAG: hypothetical protein HY926_07255 [Elusimicrobia bacterium]|nr:hypothetical protein [Elusimicrobiota bacterium]
MISISAVVLLATASAVRAQDEGVPQGGMPPQSRPPMGMGMPQEHPMVSGRYLGILNGRLSLTAEQKGKVEKILAGSKEGLQKKFAEIRKLHEEMQALEKQVNAKIRETLTEEQQQAFDEMGRMRPGGPGMRGNMGPGDRQGGMGIPEQQGGMGQGRRGRRPMGAGGGQAPQERPGQDE